MYFWCICLFVLCVLVDFVVFLFHLVSGVGCGGCGTPWTFLLAFLDVQRVLRDLNNATF